MSKHTPGPWKIDLDSTKYTMRPFVYAGSGDDRVVICELPAVMVFDTSSEMFVAAEDDDEIEANGRLIKAAPKLLEAAIDIIRRVDLDHTEPVEFAGCVFDDLRAAIASATGN